MAYNASSKDGLRSCNKSDGSLEAKEFRRLEIGDKVITGRSDDGSEGIYYIQMDSNAKNVK